MLPVKRLKLNQSIELKNAESRNTTLLNSIRNFTTDLYKCIAEHTTGNFVFSGVSLHLVLSMCALGAREKTLKEMQQVLHLMLKDVTPDDFKNVINYFENIPGIELKVANRIFTDQSIVVKDSFKEKINECFSSDVTDVDFANQCEDALNFINNWCSENTNNKIPKILSRDDVDSLTKMILTNAVYLNACWLLQFYPECTTDEQFFIDKDTKVNVPTMHQYNRYMYKDLKKWKAECIGIPYKNSTYMFVIIIPKEIDGFEQLQINFHKIHLDFNDSLGKNSNFEYKYFHLALPKFKIESDINLNEYLPKLGMAEMFTDQANFKGISEEPILSPPLHVDGIAQKAFIEVNEKGTEAAAVSFVNLRGGGGPVQWYDLKVDRPFLYSVVNKKYNLALFSGRVVQPEYN